MQYKKDLKKPTRGIRLKIDFFFISKFKEDLEGEILHLKTPVKTLFMFQVLYIAVIKFAICIKVN